MQLSDFIFDLPEELIARYPLPERSESRLLCLQNGNIQHGSFKDVLKYIQPNDLLVCNNSRVIPARLRAQKETGGKIEILVERILSNNTCLAHVRASKTPKMGSKIYLQNDLALTVTGRKDNLFELNYENNVGTSTHSPNRIFRHFLDILDALGEIPIPHYFKRDVEAIDKERYQTLYAKEEGSVAAPTAGLHFDHHLLEQIQKIPAEIDYVTLHVGSGTFAPVRVEDITQHKMHAEYVTVSETLCEKIHKTKSAGGRVIAVGTTTVRALETAAQKASLHALETAAQSASLRALETATQSASRPLETAAQSASDCILKPFQGDTQIFIYPGYQFKCIDALITNFHLPGSTLLMLVAALAGHENIMKAYQAAVQERYRFFSYGDAMWISK